MEDPERYGDWESPCSLPSVKDMNILIFGCGVIGSLYAARFSQAGAKVFVYDRGKRLEELLRKGLLYEEDGEIRRASCHVVSTLEKKYDFIFVAVKKDQAEEALKEVKKSDCDNIVVMVNSPEGYGPWEKILGQGRLIPCFPGAGGTMEKGILHGSLTPGFLLRTTFGEIGGKKTERLRNLALLMKQSGIPCCLCRRMEDWQMSHLAAAVPVADAMCAGGGMRCGRNRQIMELLAETIRENLQILRASGHSVCPVRLYAFLLLPIPLMAWAMKWICCSSAGFLLGHCCSGQREMKTLREDYYKVLGRYQRYIAISP